MTTRNFQAMLNEYLTNELMREELIKRTWLFNNIEMDDSWKGGKVPVPFEGQHASSVKFGGLTDQSDVSNYKYIRGSIDDYKEVWGTLRFEHRDLLDHSGKVKESTFLKILPGQIDQFMEYMKMVVAIQMFTGPHFAKVTADTSLATGIVEVDRIDRFSIDQKAYLNDDNTAVPVVVYVIAININAGASNKGTVQVSATRGGAALDISAFTTAQNAKFYHDGVLDTGTGAVVETFVSLKSGLLSAANGGSATLHGVTKTAWPYLQSVNINGASITANNLLSKLFDSFNTFRIKAKAGKADKCVMSYKNYATVMQLLETQKGAFKVSPVGVQRQTAYGWSEIDLMSVNGGFTLVGIQELDDSEIFFLDMSAFKFLSNGLFRKRTAPDGKQYYEVRATSGYAYLLDISLFGEVQVHRPTSCAIIYGINY